jgi:hypothetical protein
MISQPSATAAIFPSARQHDDETAGMMASMYSNGIEPAKIVDVMKEMKGIDVVVKDVYRI